MCTQFCRYIKIGYSKSKMCGYSKICKYSKLVLVFKFVGTQNCVAQYIKFVGEQSLWVVEMWVLKIER